MRNSRRRSWWKKLNTCFKAFDGIVTERGIEKIKTIGDAYMCRWLACSGVINASRVDVHAAALEMQAFIDARKKERDALASPLSRCAWASTPAPLSPASWA
ncbi:MAG: hypothetical protein IPK99_16925 [Flavobacteriales bacterium]|nr:hypothetical protein [Flavobacteriales bacterium]